MKMNFEFHCISLSFFFHLSKINISTLLEMCVSSRTHPHPLRRKPRAAHLGQASGGHRLICTMAVEPFLRKGIEGRVSVCQHLKNSVPRGVACGRSSLRLRSDSL